MNRLISKLEMLCDRAEGIAGLAATVNASADITGIDRRALKGLAFNVEQLSDDLQLICNELQLCIRYRL